MEFRRPMTWRVQSIAPGTSAVDLVKCFHSDHRRYIEVKSLVPDVDNYDGKGYLTATILFRHPEIDTPILDDLGEMSIDKDFVGFTPLNEASSDVAADIIAVTGLAGHAFGSWSHTPEKMWLRDYLPAGIQNRARVMIYGYKSQLHGADAAKSILSDFSSTFAEGLLDARDHPSARDRPLILIAITDLHPRVRKLVPVRTLLFFGAPHRGLHTQALEVLVKGQPNDALISELKHDSPTLDHLDSQFIDAIASNLSIHSYYESKPTKTVVRNAEGTVERSGELQVMVEKSSALLKHPQEKRLMVDGDHSEIAKLSRGQGGPYPNVLRVIKQGLQSASETYAVYNREQGKPDNTTPPETPPPSSRLPSPEPAEVEVESNFEAESDNEDEVNSFVTCDKCFTEFPKWFQHSICIICDDGDFVLCQFCQSQGYSCSKKKHRSYPRQLPKPEGKRKTEIEENELRCDWCLEDFAKRETHYHCLICNGGNFNLCVGCHSLDRFCPGKHELHDRKFPRRSKNKEFRQPSPHPPIKREPSPQPAATTSRLTCSKCNTLFPSRNKLFDHINQSEIDGGSCSISTQSSTSNSTCEKCKKNFPSRNKLFEHLAASKHGDLTRSQNSQHVEQKYLAGGPQVSTHSSTSCEKCKRKFPSRNKLFEHLVDSGHGD